VKKLLNRGKVLNEMGASPMCDFVKKRKGHF